MQFLLESQMYFLENESREKLHSTENHNEDSLHKLYFSIVFITKGICACCISEIIFEVYEEKHEKIYQQHLRASAWWKLFRIFFQDYTEINKDMYTYTKFQCHKV